MELGLKGEKALLMASTQGLGFGCAEVLLAEGVEVVVRVWKEGEELVIAVSDMGGGIPADELESVFDEFRQVERQGGEQREGTGLGLAIAKKTVDLLGGELLATSEVGVGTTFRVRLGGAEPTP